MHIIDGPAIANELIMALRQKPIPKTFFAGILVGDNAASASYQAQKANVAATLGIDYRLYRFPDTITNDVLREKVRAIATHTTCGAVIVQLPLPAHLNRHYIMNVIPREKDPDVLSERSLGAFYAGRNPVLPPAAATVEELLRRMQCEVREKTVAIVGMGFLVGRPVASWLMGKAKEIIIVQEGSDFSAIASADIVITGAGAPGCVEASMLKRGAGVIDFGYGKNAEGRVSGDFNPSGTDAAGVAFYTPTPKGTGPVLIAKLFENFYRLQDRGAR